MKNIVTFVLIIPSRKNGLISEEGHLMADHVHMLVSIAAKYSVVQVVGYIKGKSAIQIARRYMGKLRNFVGENFWARGYSSRPWVGMRERSGNTYIGNQEKEDQRLNQLPMFNRHVPL